MTTGKFNRTRLAPTPSGYLHLGNAYSFLLTASVARQSGAKILMRIDDLDQERVREEYIRDIFETLRFLQIEWDEGPVDESEFRNKYSQLHRLLLYNDALNKLAQAGKVFACNCSRSQLQESGPGYTGTCTEKNIPLDTEDCAWRLDTKSAGDIRIKDLNGNLITAKFPDTMDYFIVRKKDGFPSYQLASVIDDLHFGVDLIVRGEDLYHSSLAQIFLAGQLGEQVFSEITFHHHPLMNSAAGDKLSKSAGADSIQHMIKNGADKEQFLSLINDFSKGHRQYG